MPVNTTLPVEGDAFEATDLNNQFSALETGVNELAADDLSRGALRRDHLPSALNDVWTTAATRPGLQALGPSSPSSDVYSNSLAVSAVGSPLVYSATWQAFSASATTGSGGAAAPYGPGGGTGWRIVADDGDIDNAAEVRLASPYWDPDNITGDHGVPAVRCHFGLNLESSAAVPDGQGGNDVQANKGTVWLAIGYESETGARFIIERSITPFAVEAHLRGDCSITKMVLASDIPTGREVVAFFGAINTQHLGSYNAIPTRGLDDTGTNVTISYYHFNIEPMKGSLS